MAADAGGFQQTATGCLVERFRCQPAPNGATSPHALALGTRGAAHAFAIATETSGTGCIAIDNNVTVFDDLTPRPIVYTNHNDALYAVRGVVFGATVHALYGFSLDHSDLMAFAVDSTGVSGANEVTPSTVISPRTAAGSYILMSRLDELTTNWAIFLTRVR